MLRSLRKFFGPVQGTSSMGYTSMPRPDSAIRALLSVWMIGVNHLYQFWVRSFGDHGGPLIVLQYLVSRGVRFRVIIGIWVSARTLAATSVDMVCAASVEANTERKKYNPVSHLSALDEETETT
jgi:hypothetical protein